MGDPYYLLFCQFLLFPKMLVYDNYRYASNKTVEYTLHFISRVHLANIIKNLNFQYNVLVGASFVVWKTNLKYIST